MATKAVVREETKKRLSKYSTEALLTKLEKNALMGISEEIALEILEKREANSSGKGWAKNGSHKKLKEAAPQEETYAEKERAFEEEKEEEPIGAPDEESIEEVEKAEEIEKVEKTETLGKVGTAAKNLGDTLEGVAEILSSEGTKADKVRKFHALGLSILEISKVEGFDASYQSIRSVVKKIKD